MHLLNISDLSVKFRVRNGYIYAVDNISLQDGLTEHNLEDALVKKPLIQNAQQRTPNPGLGAW